MSCQIRVYSFGLALVAVAVALTVLADGQSTTGKPYNIQKRAGGDEAAAPSIPIPFMPMVNLDHKDNNSNLDVHVPIVFDMSKNDGPDRSKLDLSVMSGMVTVNRDKSRQPNGNLQGPLTVTVFGIPVYTGVSTRRNHVDRINDLVTNTERKLLGEPPLPSPTQERQVGSEKDKSEPGPMRDMLSSMKSANEKVIGTLSSLLSKMSKFLEHQSQSDGSKVVAPTNSKQLTSTIDSANSKPKQSFSLESTATKEPASKPSSSASDIASQVMTKVGHP